MICSRSLDYRRVAPQQPHALINGYAKSPVNTFSDATLVAHYCSKHGVDSILVITDPYHSRRALIIFEAEFEGTGVEVSVVNSEDYVGKLSPYEKWWQDNRTVKVIWGEISRIFFLRVKGVDH